MSLKNAEFKRDSPQTKKNEDLKGKVLANAGDLLNELRYIYKERHKKREDALNKEGINTFDYITLRLTDESEKEAKQTDKNPDKKKNHLRSKQKVMRKNLINWLLKKKQVLTGNYLKNILGFKCLHQCWMLYIIQIVKRNMLS